jgi:hypothetical protein
MKRLILTLAAVFTTAVFIELAAQSESDMKAWMAYMTPGDFHKEMAKWDGEWSEEMLLWMAPGAPPQKHTSSCVNKMIMGGRYQTSTHTGTFEGMPFEGVSTTGYDNAKKKFVSTWIDNMGTGIMIMEGQWNDNTKTLELKGKQTDPASGKEMNVRETFKIIDDDTQKMEMYMTPVGGKEYKSMEITFKRKK